MGGSRRKALRVTGPLSYFGGRITAFEKRWPTQVAVGLLLIITIAVLSGAYRKPITLPDHCPLAFRTAHNLVVHGTFSAAMTAPGVQPASGRPMPPGYPYLIAALAMADPRLAQGIDCEAYAETRARPNAYFQPLRLLQAAAGIGILVLVYCLALELTGARGIACACVVVYVVGAKLGEFARVIEPENFRNLAMFLGLYVLTVGYRKGQSALFGAAGVSLGLAALFYPSPAVLVLALALALSAVAWMSPGTVAQRWRGLRYPTAFLLGALLVTAPWTARSLYHFGDPILADRAQAQLLAFRLAYNPMPISDWPLAILSWIPSYGNMITELLFGEGTADRFGNLAPGAYFANGHAIYAAGSSATPPGGSVLLTLWRT